MEPDTSLTLTALSGRFAVVRLPPAAGVPPLPLSGALLAITVTPEEISIVCAEDATPAGGEIASGWRALRVAGELDFALVGIMAALTSALARAEVSVFALSTYTTDYLLVREEQFEHAVEALRAAGHTISAT